MEIHARREAGIRSSNPTRTGVLARRRVAASALPGAAPVLGLQFIVAALQYHVTVAPIADCDECVPPIMIAARSSKIRVGMDGKGGGDEKRVNFPVFREHSNL